MQNGAPRVDGRCALVTSMENMYLFGAGGNNNRTGTFASLFTLQGQSGVADVDAKPFGQNGILAGAARISSNNEPSLYVGCYNTADVGLGSQTWKARWSVYLTPATL